MPSSRQLVLRGARTIGAEPLLRAVQHGLEGRTRRRNRRDDDHLHLLMCYSLRRADDCVDVGANQGDMLREMLRLAPDGRHVAFEPLPELARVLDARYPQAVVHNAALGAESGEIEFHRVPGSLARSGLRPQDGVTGDTEVIRVRIERLDDALTPDFAPRLVKIDVEGAELGVVQGGMKTITRHRPIVALEHGEAAAVFGTRTAQLYELLVGEAGLRWFDMDGGGPYGLSELEETVRRRWNWVLLP